jgi:peptidyl-prolyl cis-trans isomerase D
MLVPAVDAQGNGKDGKIVEIPHKDDILKLAFESDAGVENDAFATKDDGFVWYEVREVTPSQLRPLDTVKDKAKADVIAQKVRALALDKAKKLAERAKSGIAFEDLAKEAAAEIKTVAGAKRNETGADMDSQATAAVFAVPDKGFAVAPEGDGKSAKVMQVTAVLAPKFDAKSKDAEDLAKSLGEDGAGDLGGIYVSGLQQALGVTVNEDLWRQITGGQPN